MQPSSTLSDFTTPTSTPVIHNTYGDMSSVYPTMFGGVSEQRLESFAGNAQETVVVPNLLGLNSSGSAFTQFSSSQAATRPDSNYAQYVNDISPYAAAYYSGNILENYGADAYNQQVAALGALNMTSQVNTLNQLYTHGTAEFGSLSEPIYQLTDGSNVEENGNSAGCVRVVSPSSSEDSKKIAKPKKDDSCGDDSSPGTSDVDKVFVWDLDETIIVMHTLCTGKFAEKYNKDSETCRSLGFAMETLIWKLLETHLFSKDLEHCDQPHVDDVACDDNGQDLTNYNFSTDGFAAHASNPSNIFLGNSVRGGVDRTRKLAYRYRRIREIYGKCRSDVSLLLGGKGSEDHESWLKLRREIESITDNWLSVANKALTIVGERERSVNVLVTQNQLVQAIAKVLLFGLGPVFDIGNIYSTTKTGKEKCFERIAQRFGRNSTYIVIGDGIDERAASKSMRLPFWPVNSHSDLMALHQAIDRGYL